MTEGAATKSQTAVRAQPVDDAKLAAEQERALGRNMAIGLPAGTVLIALGVGLFVGVGPALLVLAGGALLGAIVLLWASLRTLGGDAPLPTTFEEMGAASRHDDLTEQKERVLRSLKDLENERALGKLDEEDYREVSARYREEAKEILRRLDKEVAPLRSRAEEIAATYLKKRGVVSVAVDDVTREVAPRESEEAEGPREDATLDVTATSTETAREVTVKPTCPSCGTVNDADATFCKKCATRLGSEEAAKPEANDASS